MSRLKTKYCKECNDKKADCQIKCFAYNVEMARRKKMLETLSYEELISDVLYSQSIDDKEEAFIGDYII